MQIFSSIDGLSADIGHKPKAMDQSANVIKERVRPGHELCSLVRHRPFSAPLVADISVHHGDQDENSLVEKLMETIRVTRDSVC